MRWHNAIYERGKKGCMYTYINEWKPAWDRTREEKQYESSKDSPGAGVIPREVIYGTASSVSCCISLDAQLHAQCETRS